MLFFFLCRSNQCKEGPVCVRMSKTKERCCPFRLTNPFPSKDINMRANTHTNTYLFTICWSSCEKGNISFVISVCLSGQDRAGGIFVKFLFGVGLLHCVDKIMVNITQN